MVPYKFIEIFQHPVFILGITLKVIVFINLHAHVYNYWFLNVDKCEVPMSVIMIMSWLKGEKKY